MSTSMVHVATKGHADASAVGYCLGPCWCPRAVESWPCPSLAETFWRASPTFHWLMLSGEWALVVGVWVSQSQEHELLHPSPVRVSGELALLLTGYNTQESSSVPRLGSTGEQPCTSPGQHRRTGPGGRALRKLVGDQLSYRPGQFQDFELAHPNI